MDTVIEPIKIRALENRGISALLLVAMLFALIMISSIRQDDVKERLRSLIWVLWTWLLMVTLFIGRPVMDDPCASILGDWIPYYDEYGNMCIDCIFNILCFIPFTFFSKYLSKHPFVAFLISFLFSLILESLQLYFSVGAFQISDIVYNGISGYLGSKLYLMYKKKEKKHEI